MACLCCVGKLRGGRCNSEIGVDKTRAPRDQIFGGDLVGGFVAAAAASGRDFRFSVLAGQKKCDWWPIVTLQNDHMTLSASRA